MTVTYERKRKGGVKPAVEVARLLFLHGAGDGRRVLEVKELSDQTGLHPNTIRRWIPDWEKENSQIVTADSKLGSANVLSLPNEVVEKHKQQTEFILKRMEEVMQEIETLGETIAKLESLVDTIAQQADKPDTVIALFDRYLRLCMNRKSLIKLFTDLKRLWDEKVGLDSLKNIQEATAKAVSIASAKSETPSDETGVVPASGGVFSKRG